MAQMVNCDCESFGIYRIIKCFIYQSASLHCDFAKFWTPHFFLFSTLFCLDSTIWFNSTLKLGYTMLQNEVELSGLLSKYAEHVVWRSRTVLRLRVSASASVHPLARTQLHFPISSRPSRHRPNGLLSKKNFPWGVNLTQRSHMGEPQNG